MFVITTPLALPGCCVVCNSQERKQFVDLEFSMDFYGALIICELCVKSMATLLGQIDPNAEEQRLSTAQLELEVNALSVKLNALEGLADAMASYYSIFGPELGFFADSSLAMEPTSSEPDGAEPVLEGTAGSTAEGELQPSEPTTIDRPTDLFDDASVSSSDADALEFNSL